MTSSRDRILRKLKTAKAPFPDAPPRPKAYTPVTRVDNTSPEGLLRRFTTEMERLMGQAFRVKGDAEAREKVLDLLRSHGADHILAWDFRHIPVAGLEAAIQAAGIAITVPETHDEFRTETIETIRDARVGLTGADAAIAATATLVVRTGPGKGRIPTVLPPAHLVVITLEQLLPTLEDWVAAERTGGLDGLRGSGNVCFISGPSRTGDIEMEMILGVHGPGQVQVVVKV